VQRVGVEGHCGMKHVVWVLLAVNAPKVIVHAPITDCWQLVVTVSVVPTALEL